MNSPMKRSEEGVVFWGTDFVMEQVTDMFVSVPKYGERFGDVGSLWMRKDKI